MPQITWTLTRGCDNCQAIVTVNSDLGEKFKLSEARSLRDTYTKAKAWYSQHPPPYENPNFIPEEYRDFIQYNPFAPIFDRAKWSLIDEPMFYYIKCPLCSNRIYVC